jgi:hypothetical protein
MHTAHFGGTVPGCLNGGEHVIFVRNLFSADTSLTVSSLIVDGCGSGDIDLNGVTIEAGSYLFLRNARVYNIGSLAFGDSSSELVLHNCTVVINGKNSFTSGIIKISGDVTFVGGGTFTQEYSAGSTPETGKLIIGEGARLKLTGGMVYVYKGTGGTGLSSLRGIVFEDDQSTLILSDMELKVVAYNDGTSTTGGLFLKGGRLLIEGLVFLNNLVEYFGGGESVNVDYDHGLILGGHSFDCVGDSGCTNKLDFRLMSEARLEVSGAVSIAPYLS